MIQGHVHHHEAIVELEITSNPSSLLLKVESVIDTGYNGQLTLPADLISQLQLPFAGHRRGLLADGSITVLNLYIAQVLWHGNLTEVLVTQTVGATLIGMELLSGSRLLMDVCPGGTLLIEELETK